METMVLGNYKARRVSEGIIINNVELSRETKKTDRPDFLRDLDVATFAQIITNFNRRIDQQKVGAFVLLNHEGPGVGRILELRIENKQLIGDLLITNEEVIKSIESGELTERSLEWQWNADDAQLKGIALLSGDFGQDSEGWKDLTVTYTKQQIDKEFEISTSFKVQSSEYHCTLKHKEEAIMALSEEDMNMIKSMIKEAVGAMGAKAEDEDVLPEEEKAEDEVTIEEEVKAAAKKLVGDQTKEIAAMKRNFTIDTYVHALGADDAPYSDRQLRTMFKAKKTGEGMEELFKRLKAATHEDVKLEIERDYETPKLEDELKSEYKSYKERNPSTTVSEFDYIELATGKRKANLQGKSVIAVN